MHYPTDGRRLFNLRSISSDQLEKPTVTVYDIINKAAIIISLQGASTKQLAFRKLFFMPVGGERGMACYTTRTYEERSIIQTMWEAGAQAKEIADKLEAPLSSIYLELRRAGWEPLAKSAVAL